MMGPVEFRCIAYSCISRSCTHPLPLHPANQPSRILRLKLIIFGSGELAVARCDHEDPANDLALLTILARSGDPSCLCSHVIVAAASVSTGTKAICIGNPSEFDLEKGGRIKFQPPLFHTSRGVYRGKSDPRRVAEIGRGCCCCCCCFY